MFTIEYNPPLREVHCYKFDKEDDAINEARRMAEKRHVNATVSKVIKRFTVVVKETDV